MAAQPWSLWLGWKWGLRAWPSLAIALSWIPGETGPLNVLMEAGRTCLHNQKQERCWVNRGKQAWCSEASWVLSLLTGWLTDRHWLVDWLTLIVLVSFLFLDVGHFLKFLLNLFQYCFCFFMFWLFGHETKYGILAPWPGIKPVLSALEGEVLTTGLPGKPLTDSDWLTLMDRHCLRRWLTDRYWLADWHWLIDTVRH